MAIIKEGFNILLTGAPFNSNINNMEALVDKKEIEKAKANLIKMENLRQKKKQEELRLTIKKIRTLANIWNKYKIERVYLYGSIPRLRTHSQSDIDIAIEGSIDYQQLLNLYCEVDRYFSREIDIRTMDQLPFKESIKKKGVIAYEK